MKRTKAFAEYSKSETLRVSVHLRICVDFSVWWIGYGIVSSFFGRESHAFFDRRRTEPLSNCLRGKNGNYGISLDKYYLKWNQPVHLTGTGWKKKCFFLFLALHICHGCIYVKVTRVSFKSSINKVLSFSFNVFHEGSFQAQSLPLPLFASLYFTLFFALFWCTHETYVNKRRCAGFFCFCRANGVIKSNSVSTRKRNKWTNKTKNCTLSNTIQRGSMHIRQQVKRGKRRMNGSVHMRLALSTIICHCYRIWIQMNCMLELPLWGRRFTSKPIEWCVGCCSAAHRNTRYCLMQSTRTHRKIIKADCIHFEIICWRERRHRKKKWAATTRTDSISIFNGDASHWTSHTPNKRATRPQTNCASGGRIVNLKKQQTKNEHKMKTHNSFTCGNYNDWHMLLVFIQDCA